MISRKYICMILALIAVWLQARLWIGQASVAELVSLRHQIESLREANERQQGKNRRLEVEVAEFKNGLDSVDEMAREELGMIRADEAFYVVVRRP